MCPWKRFEELTSLKKWWFQSSFCTLSEKFSDFWRKYLEHCFQNLNLRVHENNLKKYICWKNDGFLVFFVTWAKNFVLWAENFIIFGNKLTARFSKPQSRCPRKQFVRNLLEKKHQFSSFWTLSEKFLPFVRKMLGLLSKTLRHDFQKLNLRVQRNHLRNKWENDDLLLILFFERKIFVLWEKNFGTFGENFTTVLSNPQITCPVNRKTNWENFFGNWHF